MKIRIPLFILTLLLVTGLMLSGCGNTTTAPSANIIPTTSVSPTTKPGVSTTASTQAKGGTLRLSDAFGVTNPGYPPKMTGAQDIRAASPAIERLFYFDSEAKIQPWLAEGYKSDATAKTITITLKKGIKFHDNTDFNAQAVQFNLQNDKTEGLAGTDKIQSVDVIDDNTVRINLTEWDNTVLSYIALVPGMMISPTAFKANNADWCKTHPVGTGPFQFVSYTQDQGMSYKKWDGYWQKGKPNLDGVTFSWLQDAVTREMAFRANEHDVMITTDTKSVSDLKNSGFKVIFGANTGGTGVVFSSANQKSPFADLKVRQAVSYAVDCESLVQSVLYGQFQYTNQPVSKGNWGYNSSVAGYPYNPEKAKSLLAEAGYAAGFSTEISYIAGTTYERINTAVQRYLSAVNIKATLAPNPPPKLTQISKVNGWDGMTFMGGGYHTDLLVTLRTSYGTTKGFSYVSMITPDDYLAAVRNGIGAPDLESKQKYAQEAMKLMIDKYCLMLPLSTTGDFCIPQANVRNLGWLDTSADTSRWNLADAWLSK